MDDQALDLGKLARGNPHGCKADHLAPFAGHKTGLKEILDLLSGPLQ